MLYYTTAIILDVRIHIPIHNPVSSDHYTFHTLSTNVQELSFCLLLQFHYHTLVTMPAFFSLKKFFHKSFLFWFSNFEPVIGIAKACGF